VTAGRGRRRRWIWLLAIPLAPVLVAGGAIAVAPLLTSRFQWARTLAWWDADVDDIHRFPARPIANAPPATRFLAPADPAAYRPLWDSVQVRRRGAESVELLDDVMASAATAAFLVLRGDTLLTERYYNGWAAESLHTSFSAAKSLASLSVGTAIARGAIPGVEIPITRLLPELAERDPRFGEITLRHLLTMTSGLGWENTSTPWGDPATTYYAPDLRAAALTARIAEPPGTRFVYNNYNPLLVGMILERATGQSVSAWFEETIWRPLGAAAPSAWSLDSERSGFEKMESGWNARAEDYARLGLLMLRGGVRGRDTIVPPAWIEESTRADSASDPNGRYQYFWWVAPADSGPSPFWAEGRFGQFIWVSPADSLVIVRLGREDGGVRWPTVFARIARRLRRLND